ncbi:hypothetical protein [Hyphococcus sp.]|uniref:hypothetical protein n=1 Tax=Hyphococcus sp. TaxID=2038636 RepID=UPI003D0D7943
MSLEKFEPYIGFNILRGSGKNKYKRYGYGERGLVMASVFSKVRRFYESVWSEAPWVRAAGFVGAASGGLFYLNQHLPSGIKVQATESSVAAILIAIVVTLYFFLVAVLFGDQVRLQKKLRALEQSFRYDKRGTLYNASEPNIAFRIATFKGILAGIGTEVGKEQLAAALVEAGRASAKDFAANLPNIFDRDIRSNKGGGIWSGLTFEQKLIEWSDYDSATGWGIFAARAVNGHLRVGVTHFRGLFSGDGGLFFGQYLAGYSETVLSEIVRHHKDGRFGDFRGVRLAEINSKNENSVEFEYELV